MFPLPGCNHFKSYYLCPVTDACSNDEVKFIIHEALMMSEFSHPHIMSIVGVAVDMDVGLPLLVMPYMENKDLTSYLRKFRYEDEFKDNVSIPNRVYISTGEHI